MTENPVAGASTPSDANVPTADQAATTPAPETSAGTAADSGVGGLTDNGTTGNPADAEPTQANPSDSSSVSDDEGAQSLAQQEEALQEKRDEVADAQAEHQDRVATDEQSSAETQEKYDGTPDGTDAA